jgi:hypothetical protein
LRLQAGQLPAEDVMLSHANVFANVYNFNYWSILVFVLRLQRMRNLPLVPRLHLSARLARRVLLIQ